MATIIDTAARIRRAWAAACAVAALLAAAPAAAGSTQAMIARGSDASAPSAPAQTRALELLQALRSYDLTTTRKFVEQSISPNALAERPVDAWVWPLIDEGARSAAGRSSAGTT